MNYDTLKKISVLVGFLAAIACLVLNLATGADLLFAAYSALWVMLTVSLILLGVTRLVIAVLLSFLHKQAALVEERERLAASGKSATAAALPRP